MDTYHTREGRALRAAVNAIAAQPDRAIDAIDEVIEELGAAEVLRRLSLAAAIEGDLDESDRFEAIATLLEIAKPRVPDVLAAAPAGDVPETSALLRLADRASRRAALLDLARRVDRALSARSEDCMGDRVMAAAAAAVSIGDVALAAAIETCGTLALRGACCDEHHGGRP